MKKNLNKLATLALTGVLMTGMSFGALADTVMSFDKVVETDKNNYTYAPNTTFTFMVTAADAETTGKTISGWNGENTSQTVYSEAGVKGGITVGTAVFASTDSESETYSTDTVRAYSKSVSLTADLSKFTKAGVYHYTLSEVTPATEDRYDGVNYDSTNYDLYAVIVNKDYGLKCDGIILSNDGVKVTKIVNDYGADTTKDSTHDVEISKTVTGALGNKTDGFEFKVTVEGQSGEHYYVTDTNGTKIKDLVSGTEATYLLADGEKIHIEGLSANDTVKVVETKANQDGYTTTVKYYAGTNDATGTVQTYDTFNVAVDSAKLNVENNRESTTPTGVVMNIAPYAAMILGAGAFAGVFLGRKKSEDEE